MSLQPPLICCLVGRVAVLLVLRLGTDPTRPTRVVNSDPASWITTQDFLRCDGVPFRAMRRTGKAILGAQASSSSCCRSCGASPPLGGRWQYCGGLRSSSSQSQGLSRKTAHQGSWWRLQGGSFLGCLIGAFLMNYLQMGCEYCGNGWR
jgi:hypothetical protein